MRYATIRELDISNGFGVGVALFVQGCPIHCKDCFNKETWDFNGGLPWTKEIENYFMQLIDRPYISRISILGGEPLAEQNINDVLGIMKRIKKRFPKKNIWLWTGYKICETKLDNELEYVKEKYKCILKYVDFLIDGSFDIKQANTSINFRGSINQNIYQVLHNEDNDKQENVIKIGYNNIKLTSNNLYPTNK